VSTTPSICHNLGMRQQIRPWQQPNSTVFLCPLDHAAKGPHTSYVAVCGELPEATPIQPFQRSVIGSKTSRVLLCEVADSGIRWIEPRDLNAQQMSLKVNPQYGVGISSHHRGGAHICLTSGKIEFVRDTLSENQLWTNVLFDADESF